MHMYNMHNISKKKCTPHFIRLYYRHQLNNGFQHFLIFMFYIFGGWEFESETGLCFLKTYLTGHLRSI